MSVVTPACVFVGANLQKLVVFVLLPPYNTVN